MCGSSIKGVVSDQSWLAPGPTVASCPQLFSPFTLGHIRNGQTG